MAGFNSIPVYEELVEAIQRLPNIGRRSAERIAYHIIESDEKEVDHLVRAIINAHDKIHKCEICGNYTDQKVCSICSDPSRDKSIICVVTRPRDIVAFEYVEKRIGVFFIRIVIAYVNVVTHVIPPLKLHILLIKIIK